MSHSVVLVRRIIIHADDFGVSRGVNEAIVDSYKRGVLTSTSVVATLPALSHAVDLMPDLQGLGFGAHLSLTLGRPAAPPSKVPLLLDSHGLLEYSYWFHIKRSLNRTYLDQVRIELDAQLAKLKGHGFKLDHADSQQHVHMIPRIRDVVSEIVREHGIEYLRHSVEPWHDHPSVGRPLNLLKCFTVASFALCRPKVGSRVGFIGLRHTGQMTVDRLLHYLASLNHGTWEIAVHPGTSQLESTESIHRPIVNYLRHPDRRMEWETLTSDQVRNQTLSSDVELINFSEA